MPPLKRKRAPTEKKKKEQALLTEFLNKPCLSHADYMAQLTDEERLFYDTHVRLTKDEILKLSTTPQHDPLWFKGREHRITGSVGSTAVCHNPYENPLEKAYKLAAHVKEGGSFQEYGTQMEPEARLKYEGLMQDALDICFKKHRKALTDPSVLQSSFPFRHIQIPIQRDSETKEWKRPIVTVEERGLMLDFQYNHRGSSVDGIVFIDGVPVWPIEIKCPARWPHDLYPIIKHYYLDQLFVNTYTSSQHVSFPLLTIDMFVYSKEKGWMLEPVLLTGLNKEYFDTWYLPREARYYFEAYLKVAMKLEKEKRASS